MATRARVTSKGQITIPAEIQQRLGLKQGDQVEFVIDHGVTVIRPSRGKANPFAAYSGALGAFDCQEAVNAWVDELRTESDNV